MLSLAKTIKDAEDETIQGGGIEITKKSSSGDSLVGAEFTIYSDAECTNEVAKYTTDADGKIITGKKAFEPGTYYVKETKEPYGYKGNNSVCPVIVSANNYATLELTDEEKTGSVVIRATTMTAGTKIPETLSAILAIGAFVAAASLTI